MRPKNNNNGVFSVLKFENVTIETNMENLFISKEELGSNYENLQT